MFNNQQYSRVSTKENNTINTPFCGETNTDINIDLQTNIQ